MVSMKAGDATTDMSLMLRRSLVMQVEIWQRFAETQADDLHQSQLLHLARTQIIAPSATTYLHRQIY
jgi:hypothetical protein